jgi:predicted RNA-binding protein associated with RNAse of E/G family
MMDKENRTKEKKAPRVRATASASASGTSTPTEGVSTGERKRVVAENGKVLIVDSVGNVFLEEEDEEGVRKEFLLDVDEIQKPGITETMVFQLPIWCFNKTVGRVFGSADADVEEEVVDEDEVEAEAEAVTSATSNTRSRRRGKRSQR